MQIVFCLILISDVMLEDMHKKSLNESIDMRCKILFLWGRP